MVLDAGQAPISGATVTIEGRAVSGITDAEGRFLLAGVPVGAFVLKVDPASSPRPETFPPLEFEIVTIAGVENILGMPVILPEIDTDTAKLVGGNEDVVLEMKGVPGATLTVLANSATFPDGSTTGLASVSQVHMDQVPMRPPNGTLPPLAGTLQPLEAKFDPPVRVQFPNSNGLAPGTIIDMFQFHHDTSRFVPVGKGTVTADGRFVVSDPGFGLQTGGWHVTSPPPPPPACAPSCTECNTPVVTDQQTCTFTCEPQTGPACDDGDQCTAGDVCTNGTCGGNQDDAEGVACDDGVVCTGNDVCTGGSCQGDPAAADGLACDDEEQCTANDVCQGGSCQGDPAAADGLACDDEMLCTGADVCQGGSCVGDPAAADGVPCDDQNLCTGNDVCTGGTCAGDPAAAEGVVCDDGEVCTGNDVCTGGTCVGDPAVQENQTCDDGVFCTGNDVCTSGSCVGDASAQESVACDDKNDCTGNDVCQAGSCVGDPAVQEGQACDDKDSCTIEDKCLNGQCTSKDMQVDRIEGPDFVVLGDSETYYAKPIDGASTEGFEALTWTATNARRLSSGKGSSATFKFEDEGDWVVKTQCEGKPNWENHSGQTAISCNLVKLACGNLQAFKGQVCIDPSSWLSGEVTAEEQRVDALKQLPPGTTTYFGMFRHDNLLTGNLEECVNINNQFCLALKNPKWSYQLGKNPDRVSRAFNPNSLIPGTRAEINIGDVTADNCKAIVEDYELIPKGFNPKSGGGFEYSTIEADQKIYRNINVTLAHEEGHRNQYFDLVIMRTLDAVKRFLDSNCITKLTEKTLLIVRVKQRIQDIRFLLRRDIFDKLDFGGREDEAFKTELVEAKLFLMAIKAKAQQNFPLNANTQICHNPPGI